MKPRFDLKDYNYNVVMVCKSESDKDKFLEYCRHHGLLLENLLWGTNYEGDTFYICCRLFANGKEIYTEKDLTTNMVFRTEHFGGICVNYEDFDWNELNVKVRPTKDEYYLGIAEAVSKRSTCLRRQYGAVIVRDDEIKSTGYNGSPRDETNCCDIGYCKRTTEGHMHNDGDYSSCFSVHSEQNAIISASRQDMIGATLYLYGSENGKTIDAEPCPICARMIKNAGITRVVGSKG